MALLHCKISSITDRLADICEADIPAPSSEVRREPNYSELFNQGGDWKKFNFWTVS